MTDLYEEHTFYLDLFTIRDDRIMLYRRADTKRPIWYARLNVPGKGYVIRSTKTVDRHTAVVLAEDMYDEIRWKIKNNMPVKDRAWKDVWAEYRKTLLVRVRAGDLAASRLTRIDSCWTNWLSKYWGDRSCGTLAQKQLDGYWHYRMNAKEARSTTLHDESSMLSPIFKFALRQGYINKLAVDYSPPIKKKLEKRGAFTAVQLRDIARFTRVWHKSNSITEKTRYNRQLLHHFILINCNCGLRPGEMYNLKWQDVRGNGNGNIKLIVKDGKTGTRVAVPMPCVKRYLEDWREITHHNADDDFVFPQFNGKHQPAHGVGKLFTVALGILKLNADQFGQPFSVYSFRHTYATNRLRKHVDPYLLEKVMGTSRDMLKQHYDHVMIEDQTDELTKR